MYLNDPLFGRRCTACGMGRHSYLDSKGELLCPQFKNGVTNAAHPTCTYPFCNRPYEHRNIVCPTMHHVCSRCRMRGHLEESGCGDWDAEGFTQAKRIFEASADTGLWTKHRYCEERYGFFSHRKGTPFPFPCHYKKLIRMPHTTAVALLTSSEKIGHDPRPRRRPLKHGKSGKSATVARGDV